MGVITWLMLIKSFVRHYLEFGKCVWHQCKKSLRDELERYYGILLHNSDIILKQCEYK